MITIPSDTEVMINPDDTEEVLGVGVGYIFGGAIFLIFIGSGIITAIQQKNIDALIKMNEKALANKYVHDAAEQAYMQGSIGLKELVNLIKSGVIFVDRMELPVVDKAVSDYAKFLESTTDEDPNT